MAEGTGGNKDLSLITAGSEAVYDFFCEICRESGLNLEAVGYCVDCGDYLCNTCFTHHKRSRLTLNHVILDQDDMPKDTPLSQDKCNRYIDSKCNIHSGRTNEYYCKNHDFLGCSVCITTNHRNCSNVDFICDLPENFDQSMEYKTFEESLKTILQRSAQVIQQSRDNITRAKTCGKQTLQAIRRHREEINKLLDEIEKSLIKQTETIEADIVKVMESAREKAQSISGNVQKISSKMKNLQTSMKLCQLYIAMREFSSDIKCMTSSLDEAMQKYDVRLYEFVPSSTLTEMMKEANGFGTIHIQQSSQSSSSVVTMDRKDTVALHLSDIDLRPDSKSSTCNITGSAVLSRNKLICVDYNNQMISLLDTQSNKLVCEVKSEKGPWDVCAISGNQAAITTVSYQTIMFMKVTDIICVEKELSLNGQCRGIAYSLGRLGVSFEHPSKIEIIDLHGNVINKIQTTKMGVNMFKWPWYVCFSSEGDTIYISDNRANSVIHMAVKGDVKSVYTDKELCTPYKVCADQRGNIYVASYDNKTVHMLTADCSKIQVLLTETDGLSHEVKSVSHCFETNRLFVGMCGNSKIKVFQLQ